jgi:gp078
MAFNNRNNPSDLMIEDAKILFTNFAGSPTRYNSEGGKREFSVALPLNLVEDLERDGWNVKFRKNADGEFDPERPYLGVKVSYKFRVPAIWLIASGRKQLMTEDTVGTLDNITIKTADIVIHPSVYDIRGQKGISAYVKELYVVMDDESASFASKYADLD